MMSQDLENVTSKEVRECFLLSRGHAEVLCPVAQSVVEAGPVLGLYRLVHQLSVTVSARLSVGERAQT